MRPRSAAIAATLTLAGAALAAAPAQASANPYTCTYNVMRESQYRDTVAVESTRPVTGFARVYWTPTGAFLGKSMRTIGTVGWTSIMMGRHGIPNYVTPDHLQVTVKNVSCLYDPSQTLP